MMALKAAAWRNSRTSTGGWLKPLHDWPSAAIQCIREEGVVVRVVVATVRGSAPREVGACMLIERTQTLGTIGGGQLEWAAVAAGRRMLAERGASTARVDRFVLATELAQCCGGVVDLWMERYTQADLQTLGEMAQAGQSPGASLLSILDDGRVSRRIVRTPAEPSRIGLRQTEAGSMSLLERLGASRPQLWLYGAGHVGQALIRMLAELPVQVTWIDPRATMLPAPPADNIRVAVSDEPLKSVGEAPERAYFLVMTHSHPLDYTLCRAILERDDYGWAGVIGSSSKAARFRSRLAADGVPPERIARLQCPVGIDGIRNKSPGAIAVAIAAQLLQLFECTTATVEAATTSGIGQASCRGDCGSCHPTHPLVVSG